MRLWKNFGGEPYLINPHLISLNPRKKRKKSSGKKRSKSEMARRRDSKGRFVKTRKRRAKRNPPRRTRRRVYARSNTPNPPRRRRRSTRRRTTRRTYRRRNPVMTRRAGKLFMGMSLNEILFTGAGFVAPPIIEGFVKPWLPAALTTNAFGKYAVKAGSVVIVSWAGGQFMGRQARKYLGIGGVTYLVASLIVDYAPQIFSGFGAYLNPGTVTPPARLLRGQANLGKYTTMGNANYRTPDRLNSSYRF